MGECRMKTVFTASKRRTIPKRFEECVREDAVSSRLWSWCNILESLAYILPLIFVVVSAIAFAWAVAAAYRNGANVEFSNSKPIFGFNYEISALIRITWRAFLIWLSCYLSALLIGALASIVQSTRISSDLALYEISSANNAGDRKRASGTENMAAAPLGAESEEENPQFPMN